MVETSPNGSSLGSRSAFNRAMYRNSPTVGSWRSQVSRKRANLLNLRELTSSSISSHVDDGVTAVHNIVVGKSVRFASDLDVIA